MRLEQDGAVVSVSGSVLSGLASSPSNEHFWPAADMIKWAWLEFWLSAPPPTLLKSWLLGSSTPLTSDCCVIDCGGMEC